MDLAALAAADEQHAAEHQRPGAVGTHVAIVERGQRWIGLITAARAEGDGAAMTIVPLGEIDDEGEFSGGVSSYPRLGAKVQTVRSRDLRALFMKSRADGFGLGTIPTVGNTPVTFNPRRFFGRHVAVLGQSGAGKSWAVATMIQRAIKVMPGAHVILLDLHGEYCWREPDGGLGSAFDARSVRYLDARELEIPYWLLTFAELVDLLVDRRDERAATQIAYLREQLEDLRRSANTHLKLPHLTVDSPVYFSLAELLERFRTANNLRLDFGKTPGPLFGMFDELLLRFESRMTDVRYGFLFNPSRRTSSESMEGLLRDFVGLGEPRARVTVIDMSTVPFDVRPTVSAQIGRLAFEFNYWNPAHRQFPLFLVCEEAHAYIPRSEHSEFAGARRSMERIAKEGRKYGVGLCVVSQRPHELSETVLAQCGNFLCLRITNPEDQAYLRRLVPESVANLTDVLSALGRGEALALGEALPVPVRFQLFRPSPTPRSEDIDFYAGWTEGVTDLPVDQVVRRWRWQER